MRKELDFHCSNCDNFLLLDDSNSEITDTSLKDFCQLFSLKNWIKKPTYFKSPKTPKTIDLVLTNLTKSFCNFDIIKTGFSDFRNFTATVLKAFSKKQLPSVINYRS